MYASQACYRELYESIHDYEGNALYNDILLPWIQTNYHELRWFYSFSQRVGQPIPEATDEDRCRLYALSRVVQLLQLRFQRGRADGADWPGPEIIWNDYLGFTLWFGLKAVSETQFTPFSHEIVEVDVSPNDDAPVSLIATFWPALMLGDMMFSRAGVRIAGGCHHISKVAESSTLYWAYRRKHRPYHDQSHGWGSNSQWRTAFRRDYRIGGRCYYNVDGKEDLARARGLSEDGLNPNERIELLIHRCFIKTIKPHGDLYPYSDRYVSEFDQAAST